MSRKTKKLQRMTPASDCRCDCCGELIDLDGKHHGPKASPGIVWDALDRHIEEHWGRPELVMGESEPGGPPVILRVIPASEDRPFYTVVTKGISEYPMEAPEGIWNGNFVELVMCLPQGWPYDRDSINDPRTCWPFRLLFKLANVAHQDGGWIGCPYIYPFPAGGYKFADDVNFATFLFAPPCLGSSEEAWQADVGEGKSVNFLGLIPVFESEAQYGESHGPGRLLLKLWDNGVTELLDKNRPAVA